MVQSGRPVKRGHSEADSNVQKKRGRKEHTKRKQNLRQNELKTKPIISNMVVFINNKIAANDIDT